MNFKILNSHVEDIFHTCSFKGEVFCTLLMKDGSIIPKEKTNGQFTLSVNNDSIEGELKLRIINHHEEKYKDVKKTIIKNPYFTSTINT